MDTSISLCKIKMVINTGYMRSQSLKFQGCKIYRPVNIKLILLLKPINKSNSFNQIHDYILLNI